MKYTFKQSPVTATQPCSHLIFPMRESHQSKAVWRLEWPAMATGSMVKTGPTGPRPCPTASWKEEELSGLGEGTEEEMQIDL